MPVTHPTAIRNALADFIVDQFDTGTPPGKIIMQTGAGATVATLTFANPAFGAASSGIATANAIVSDNSAVGGTVAKAELRQGNATPIVLCTVTATGGGGDIVLNSIVISAGQQVSLTALTYAAPA